MIRLSIAALATSLLVTLPALSADLVVDAAPPAADAPSRAYATLFAGASLPHSEVTAYDGGVPVGITFDLDFSTGYIVGGAVGTALLPSLRGEIEFSVVKSTVVDFLAPGNDIDSTGYNLLGNLWYDIETGSGFTPYIGGGVGYGYDVIEGTGGSDNGHTTGLLYQLGAGVRVAAGDNITLDLGYRYRVQPDAQVDMPDLLLDPDDEIKSSATNHIVTAGVSFGF